MVIPEMVALLGPEACWEVLKLLGTVGPWPLVLGSAGTLLS